VEWLERGFVGNRSEESASTGGGVEADSLVVVFGEGRHAHARYGAMRRGGADFGRARAWHPSWNSSGCFIAWLISLADAQDYWRGSGGIALQRSGVAGADLGFYPGGAS